MAALRRLGHLAVVGQLAVAGLLSGCSATTPVTPTPANGPPAYPGHTGEPVTPTQARSSPAYPGHTDEPVTPTQAPSGPTYPWHTGIVATTFWVGEVFDPSAADGSQIVSTYDGSWLAHYGGCDGIVVDQICSTERRSSSNGFFPTARTPLENPFYLDLPFDDIHDPKAFARRATVIPWGAGVSAVAARDPSVSLLKNRWVRLRKGSQVCFGQVEDAGPGVYDDASYVFGADDARPSNTRFGGAGLDVSPALNGCLRFTDLNGDTDHVDWQFVADRDVPPGPWRALITTSGVSP